MPTSITTVSRLGETGLIQRIERLVGPAPPGVFGIGDDTAVLPRPKGALLWTTDAMVEGTHFRTAWSRPEEVGHKAIVANLSDAAAMGGSPRSVLVSLALPGSTAVEAVERLYRGLLKAARSAGVDVLGGNVCRAPNISITIGLLGEFPKARPRFRSGARPGDRIYVTGQPGWSCVGLKLLGRAATDASKKKSPAVADLWNPPARREPEWRTALAKSVSSGRRALKSYLVPEPRLRAARDLHHFRPTALLDVSDGLLQDLHHLARASQVAVELEAESLPRAAAFSKLCLEMGLDPVATMLEGGEDYELVFTAGSAAEGKLGSRPVLGGVPVTGIGRVISGVPGVWLREGTTRTALRPDGYHHFAE